MKDKWRFLDDATFWTLMGLLLALAFFSGKCTAQVVMPAVMATREGPYLDGGCWHKTDFRAVCRYGPEHIPPMTVTRLALRGNATWTTTYDREPGTMTIRAGTWDGQSSTAWPSLPVLFQARYDPPRQTTVSLVPGPFNLSFPLTAPILVGQGQGFQADFSFDGDLDPKWGNWHDYEVDVAGNPDNGGPACRDQNLDPVEPWRGCGGYFTETRADRQWGYLHHEGKYMPAGYLAVMMLGSWVSPSCWKVQPMVQIPLVVDSGGHALVVLQPPPGPDLAYVWQYWVYDLADPSKSFGPGHLVWFTWGQPYRIEMGWSADLQAPSPTWYRTGLAWTMEVR